MRFSLVLASALLGSSLVHAGPLPPEPDKGFVTDVHKDKVGTIVFARSAAAVATPEKPAEFVDTFKSSDTIFLRAYLPHSLNNAFRAQGVECADPFRVWSIEVDGKQISKDNSPYFYWEKQEKDAFKLSTSIRYDHPLNGKPTDEESIWRAYQEVVAPTLPPGEHTIRLAVRGSCDALTDRRKQTYLASDLASGTFKLTVAKGAAVEILPKPARRDAKLVSDATALLTRAWKPDQIVKVVIVEKNWTIEYETSAGRRVPQRRVINTVVAAKQTKGCRVFDVKFEQPATSNTAFGPTAVGGTGGSREVTCDAFK